MARPKDQRARREHLTKATLRTIADRGLSGVTMKNIAEEAGISPRLIAYYYDTLDELVEAAHQMATERFYGARRRAIEDEAASPSVKMVRLIDSGLPEESDLLLSQVLNEVWVNAARSPMHATLGTLLFDREVSLYRSVLQEGSSTREFDLRDSADAVARNFVLLEDALGMHLLGNNSSVSREGARRQLASYAKVAVGVDLDELDVLAEGTGRHGSRIAP